MTPPATRNAPRRLSLLFRPLRQPSNTAIACLSALAAVTILNVIFTLYTIYTINDVLPQTREWSWIGDDFPSELPVEIPLAGLSVETGEDHFSLYDDDEWGTLFPSDGFVRLGPNDRTFLVSLYHQLHCLDIIRVGYLTNRTHAFEHIQHCLRYLRQILVCHADTTLEDDIPQFLDGGWTHSANGVGSVHSCKDWTVLRRWVEDHPSLPVE
ncbi:hypothetical protein L210DRAFT_3397650 [Boletus edulis BED1]|uniref:Uncharacterized protein n=1 Tax=Boletus edulis BED1 TaxID=1328754 RepID=A0AAD4GGH8_BOLED|nr:hypothetical protein L210DRAFT_3397650 [Boletus edulis BED1]